MSWRKCCTAPRPSAGGCARRRRESRPEDRFPPVPAAPGAAQDQDPGEEAPGDNTSSPAGRPEDRTQPAVRHSRRRAVGHRGVSVPRSLSVEADQSSADETDRGPCPPPQEPDGAHRRAHRSGSDGPGPLRREGLILGHSLTDRLFSLNLLYIQPFSTSISV